MDNSTHTNNKQKPLTFEDLKKASEYCFEKKEKDLPKGLGWFTKLMAKFGWHRQYEVMIFDKSKFGNPYMNSLLSKPPKL